MKGAAGKEKQVDAYELPPFACAPREEQSQLSLLVSRNGKQQWTPTFQLTGHELVYVKLQQSNSMTRQCRDYNMCICAGFKLGHPPQSFELRDRQIISVQRPKELEDFGCGGSGKKCRLKS